jgi:hypothetical protein
MTDFWMQKQFVAFTSEGVTMLGHFLFAALFILQDP